MSRNISYILFGGILVITVILAVLMFQQGDLLRTGVVLNNDDAVLDEATPPAAETDESPDLLESYCAELKAGHILNCGMMMPEHDFTCRTTEADAAYQTCLTTTSLEDIPPTTTELTEQPGSEEPGNYNPDL